MRILKVDTKDSYQVGLMERPWFAAYEMPSTQLIIGFTLVLYLGFIPVQACSLAADDGGVGSLLHDLDFLDSATLNLGTGER